MRFFAILLAIVALSACSDGTDTRRISGGGGGTPVDETAQIADAVLANPIGYVDDRAPRTALVIGNSSYAALGSLDNPANDARLVSRTLQGLGFRLEGGGPLFNLSGAQMRAAVANYRQSLASRGGVGLVYFAGHAVQVNGRNWLAPSDARPASLADISRQFVPAEALFGQGGNRGAVNMVILDACRDNPFQSQSGARSSPIPELRGTSAGLSRVVAPPDTLVAFATAPGAVALDGSGANSPYAAALSRALAQPGARVEDVFINTRNIVERSTGGVQTPWETSSLTKRVVLNSGRSSGPRPTSQFDGTWIGAMKCNALPGDWGEPTFSRAGGQTLRVDIRNGRGRHLKGAPEPLKVWDGGTFHESWEVRVTEDGRVRAPGQYQYTVDPDPASRIYTDYTMYVGQADGDQIVMRGARGPRQCTIELTRL